MDLGIFMMPLHAPDKPFLTSLREDQAAVLLADEIGCSEAWVGEHYSSESEPITSPLIFLASLMAETKQIKFGTGVINLPQQHPAVVAGHVAMFDQLCEGRFIFGIGAGGLASDFELFQMPDVATRGQMLAESIQTILEIWKQDPPYEIDGKHWNISLKDAVWPEIGVGRMARPYQQPHPPIAMSIMSPSSSTAKVCGTRGWIPLSANFLPSFHLASHWAMYVEGCEAAGHRPDRSKWRVARNIVVAESDAEAEDYIHNPDNAPHFYYEYLITMLKKRNATAAFKTRPDMTDDEVDAAHGVKTMYIAGSPDTVTEKLVALREETGDFGTLIATQHDWDDVAFNRRSLTLLANEVMPRFRAHAEATQAAE